MYDRMIINKDPAIPDDTAFDLVSRVIGCGKISDNGRQYCHVVTFTDKDVGDVYVVSSTLRKTGGYTFYVTLYGN
jgi:hypothetical protein